MNDLESVYYLNNLRLSFKVSQLYSDKLLKPGSYKFFYFHASSINPMAAENFSVEVAFVN